MSSKGPSKHLSWKELACKDETSYPAKWRHSRVLALATLFERIRKDCGNKSIRITSAYRTHEWNKLIGGARNSQHKEGRALDLIPPKGMSVNKFYKIIRDISYIGGIGRYKSFVHIDIRPSSRLVAWTGKGTKDLLT